MVRINIDLPGELHKQLKVKAANEGKLLKKVIIDTLWINVEDD